MSTTFRPYASDQDLLLPPSLRAWLAPDHVAYFIGEVVEEPDLTAFYAPYEGDGRRKMPCESRMMLKVLIYGYVSGVYSSRKIARKLEEDVAFRLLAAGNFPKLRTISEFRRRHLKDFKAPFITVVQIARAAGLGSLGTLAVDGTKVRANASKHKAMAYQRMQEEERRLSDEIASMCDLAADQALDQRGIDAYVSVRQEGKDIGDIDAKANPATHRTAAKLSTPDGRERYRDRSHIAEAVNGWIKEVMGFRRFSVRGLDGTKGE